MKVSTIKSTWLPKGGFRLDCSPYLGGAIETEILLEELPVRKDSLGSVASAIFNGPQFVRNYVDDPDYGVPFMTGSTMLLADLSNLPLLSKRDALSSKLSHLQLQPSMTLISCSGSIGKMAYARPGMHGIWASQDILKVVADPGKILPGYLYAFLSSKFGVPLITSGTYGAIIQHLEPAHITGLSVPRFGDAREHEIHQLVEEAARLLDESGVLLRQATNSFFESMRLADVCPHDWQLAREKDLGFTVTQDICHSFRSLGYAPRVQQVIASIKQKNWKPLGELCSPGLLARGSRFSRIDASEEFGTKMVGQRDLFSLKPEGRLIATSKLPSDAFVEDGTILIAAQGTLGEKELFCRAQFITENWVDFAYSEHVLKVLSNEEKMLRGCLFAFLRSESAFRMLRSVSSGSKLQDHNYFLLPRLPIPIPSPDTQADVDRMVRDAYTRMHKGIAFEDQAVELVESAILNP